jgi:RNA polymerase sigma-70 factor (ECF subfamily)
VALHRGYLYRYALSRLRHADMAEELVQDTMLAALEGCAHFRGESALRTWLAGILKHKIVDWQRREARNPLRLGASTADSEREREDEMDAFFDESGDWISPPTAWPDPEQSLLSRRFWEMFEGCLADLPAATARAFYLREIQGMSTDEICAELSISQSNCWVMLHRARMSLRRYVEERWFQSGES